MNRTTLKIDGMTCGHCVAWVKKALTGLEGVTVENVAVGSATVTHDPAATSAEQIARAVSDAGYPARPAA
jgi:copper chaperone CopZ